MTRFSLGQLSEATEFLNEEGWVAVRGVFSTPEVLEYRQRIQQSVSEGYDAGDLPSNPYLGNFMLDPRVAELATALLSGTPVYFGDSSLQCDAPPRTLMFHKDNPDKFQPQNPDWQSPYTLVRLAVYLQDCESYSGGLAVRRRSHLIKNSKQGRPYSIPSQEGDVVAFKLSTTHAGFATRLRLVPTWFLPVRLQRWLAASTGVYLPNSWWLRPLHRRPRMGLFVTFGVEDAHLVRYLQYFKTRPYAVRRWKNSDIDPVFAQALQNRGIRFLDLRSEMGLIDHDMLSEDHVDLPA